MHADLGGHALGRQERGIGPAHQLAGRSAHLADGHADGDARVIAPVLHAHGVLHAMREAVPGIRAAADQDRCELVPAEAVALGRAIGRSHGSRDGPDALVAHRMAEALVRLLEAVEVEHDQADAPLRERAAKVVVERAAIAQPGEGIRDGGLLQVGQLGVGACALATTQHSQEHEQGSEQQQAGRERRHGELPAPRLRAVHCGESRRGRASLARGEVLERARDPRVGLPHRT